MKMLSQYYKETFGCKVYKLSLDGGLTCPNRDGTLSTKGCIFCTGSGEFAERLHTSVSDQLEQAKARVAGKTKSGKFIAYFQSFTNTYAPVEKLKALYSAAIAPDYIVGLAIGTRPDCLGPDVIDLLGKINQTKPVYVELGLQTIHEKTVRYIRREYPTQVYFEAMKNLHSTGIHTVTHIILGLPGETIDDMVETTQAAVDAGTAGIKFHLLHVLRGTDLAEEYAQGKFACLTLEEYGQILKKCTEILPDDMILHRITGDGAKRDLIAPLWSADKKKVLNYLYKILELQ